ncbi:DnaJ domain-containing protein [Xylaria sp. FL0064]|nr:DnaJ domain-containing protein [Xylaria sp. FL0064]
MWVRAFAWMPASKTGLSHYEVLNISTSASDNEIKRAYRKGVLRYHPDKVQRLGAAERAYAKSKFDKLTSSYELLLSNKRCSYDRHVMKYSYKQYRACLKRNKARKRAEFEWAQKNPDRFYGEEQEERELSKENRDSNLRKKQERHKRREKHRDSILRRDQERFEQWKKDLESN